MSQLWLVDRLSGWSEREAFVLDARRSTYRELSDAIGARILQLRDAGVIPGSVVTVEGDHSPDTCATLLALLEVGAVAVPMSPTESSRMERLLQIAGAEYRVSHANGDARIDHVGSVPTVNDLLIGLRDSGTGGLILFTSGYTGPPKAGLHAGDRFLEKYRRPTRAYRALAVPTFDHLAGLDTLFYSLASGGSLVCPGRRDPETVAALAEQHGVELLPASPTFLNLMLAADVFSNFDLSGLKLIAYGSEVMPETTLTRLRAALPGCRFVQKYGLTELGSPRTRNEDDGSLWIKIDSEGVEHRIVDGVLWVRSRNAMLGYLNAPSPFDDAGWFCTEDLVEVNGDYLRILGRVTDVINVGGHKVNPAEVEEVVLRMDNIRSAAVYAEPNVLTGQSVAARVSLEHPEEPVDLVRRLRKHCRASLAPYQVPIRVEIGDQTMSESGHKLIRPRVSPSIDSDAQSDAHPVE